MATDQLVALSEIGKVQKSKLADYQGKMSNQFVAELKGSTLFQFNWSELLSAAPTALSLLGACWIAASATEANRIEMGSAMPTDGFTYLVRRPNPTLRTLLIDVCNRGGFGAFTVAGANMDGLQIRAQRICAERINEVFIRLGPCNRDANALEDFNDALESFSAEAKECAKLATEVREAFSFWGKMVGELHACSEQKFGMTNVEVDKTKQAERLAEIDKTFASQAVVDAKSAVKDAAGRLDRAEKRLTTAVEKVPGPWETCITGAVAGFTQSLPSIVAGVLPAVLAASNPASAIGSALGGAIKGNSGQIAGQALGAVASANGNNQTVGLIAGTLSQALAQNPNVSPAAAATSTSDPSYSAAVGFSDIVSRFYQFIGGDSGPVDWTKFTETPAKGATSTTEPDGTPQGIVYLLGNIKGQKGKVDVTTTEPNKKLIAAMDAAYKVAEAIQEFQNKQKSGSTEKLADSVHAEWRASLKKARDDTLTLASVATSATGSNAVPNPFANVKIDVPKADLSAQNAQLSTAMQAVQMAQGAVDTAQDAYDGAVAKANKQAEAMAQVEKRLKTLQDTGKTLEGIVDVLRDCISVLVDLAIQVSKIEQFFTMLTTVIDHVIMVRAGDFTKTMGKVGVRMANNTLVLDDVIKQTIYTSTLQLKGYFSLLGDIASMYSQINREHIIGGMDLCRTLQKASVANEPTGPLQEQLSKYTQSSAKAVADLVKKRQDELLKGLRKRAQDAVEGTQGLEKLMLENNLKVDNSAKDAIKQGGETMKEAAKIQLESTGSATAQVQNVLDY